MKITLREITFMVLLMAIPTGAWWFVFRPNNARNAEMLNRIEAKQLKLRELNRATAVIGDLKKEVHSLEKAISFFRSKLPSEKEIDKVLQEIWRLAEANKLTTKSIRTLQRNTKQAFTTANDPFAEQPIAVQLEGDFLGFYSFMLAIENQPRVIRIRKMTLKKLDKAPRGHIKADFEMSIFFERSQEDKQWASKS